MRDAHNAFHLAIPVTDLDAAERFYVGGLGCHLARRYDDRITLDFFGDQLVCHLSNDIDEDPDLYPRHFGVTFRHRDEFDAVLYLAVQREIPFFRDVQPRFKNAVEEHVTFVVRDPSNNLIEFKHYRDPRMMY
jgi:extradiol dioxygenase family protein